MHKRFIFFPLFIVVIALASWGIGGCGNSSTTSIDGFPLVGGGYLIRDLDDIESCLGPMPSSLSIDQSPDNPDQLTIKIIRIWESGLIEWPGSMSKSAQIIFEGIAEKGNQVSCEGQALFEGVSKSDITLPLECTVDSKLCHVTFDGDSTPLTLFSSCEFAVADKATALTAIEGYDVSPMPQEAIDALKIGCIYSSKLEVSLFLEAFLCSIGVNPSLVDDPDSAGIDPDIYGAVDDLEFIDLDNLAESCENEIAAL